MSHKRITITISEKGSDKGIIVIEMVEVVKQNDYMLAVLEIEIKKKQLFIALDVETIMGKTIAIGLQERILHVENNGIRELIALK